LIFPENKANSLFYTAPFSSLITNIIHDILPMMMHYQIAIDMAEIEGYFGHDIAAQRDHNYY